MEKKTRLRRHTRLGLQRIDLEIAVGKRRVAQAIAEVVERSIDSRLLAFPLRVWFCGKIERNLPNSFREGHRQFAARIVVTKQHVGDSGTTLHSGKPGFENARHIL